MIQLKQVLQTYIPVIIGGMLDSERYQWWKGLIRSGFGNVALLQEIEKGEGDIPLIFFANSSPACWIETDEDILMEYPVTLTTEEGIQAKYFSVSDRSLPAGFVFIMLPSFGKSLYFDLSQIRLFRDGDWIKREAYLLWMDSFPFVQDSALRTFERLNEQLRPIRSIVGILESSRRYAYSDLEAYTSIEEQSASEWKKRVSCDDVTIINPEQTDRRFFASLLYRSCNRLIKAEEQVKEEVKQALESLEKYSREDYDYIISEHFSPEMFEPIFDYDSWNEEAPSNFIHYLNRRTLQLVSPALNERIMGFIEVQIAGREVYNVREYFGPLIDSVWEDCFAVCSKRFEQIKIPLSTSHFDFMVIIKALKIAYIEQLNEMIQVSMYDVLYKAIKKHYELWNGA